MKNILLQFVLLFKQNSSQIADHALDSNHLFKVGVGNKIYKERIY